MQTEEAAKLYVLFIYFTVKMHEAIIYSPVIDLQLLSARL
jgi:hypothetical protein